ncbi:MAG TPA: phosphoribosylamine--glycine ligase [Candidatus Binatia bacterium]|nr:phosphoribosylamine--glycine ligase [Candidatus Binatia bacterium]
MRILVVGGGGREHALVWKLAQSPRAEAIFCAPGNAGIAAQATCVPIAPGDIDGLLRFAQRERIDLTVVGPELPLALGLVDRFAERGLRAFGPTAAAARLEGSKAFTKALLRRLGVPTAEFAVFDDAEAAARHVRARGAPVVVKADGLASGKGVFVCATVADALAAIDEVMRRRAFGDAGARVVVEDCLVGEELSFMAITDGTTVLPLAPAQDHKRALDGDRGPNTGGMGAYSPAPVATPALQAAVMREVMEPVVRGLAAEGVRYTGVLYAGLMVHEGRAQVLEFNVRLGDPEAQVLLVRLRGDLVDLLMRACDGRLAGAATGWDPRAAVCVVLAAAGYPGEVAHGQAIAGLERLAGWRDGVVFHAATRAADGRVLTAGGRVLGVTALGDGIRAAVDAAYAAVAQITWPGMHFRRDIGRRALGGAAEEAHGGA